MEKDKKKAKKKIKKKVDKKKKESLLKNMKLELSKVKWPEAKEVIKYTVATVVMCLFIGLFFQLLEFVSSLIKGFI